MKNIRMGIFGCNRGMGYADHIMMNNAEIVAVCDKDQRFLNNARNKLGDGVAYYSDFEEFFKHDMDAVLLAVAAVSTELPTFCWLRHCCTCLHRCNTQWSRAVV